MSRVYRWRLVVEEISVDLTVAIAEDGVDKVDVEIGDAEPIVPPPLSLLAIMETFMMTQAAYSQLLDELISEVAALRADFTEYKSAFPPLPPSDS